MNVKLVPLEQAAKIYSGSNLKNGKDFLGEGGCPWVKVEDLNNGMLKETSEVLSEEEMRKVKVSPADTVFFSNTGTIGKVGIAGGCMAPSNNMFAVEFDRTQVLPLYGMYCLLAMKETFQAEASGAVYASLRLSSFRKIRIPVPDLDVQNKIAGKLDSLREGERQQKKLIDEIKELAHSLFEQYFSEYVKEVVEKGNCLRLGECAEVLLNGAAKKKRDQGTKVRYVATPQLNNWEIVAGQVPREEVEQEKIHVYRLRAGDIVMNRINSAERLGKCGIVLGEPEDMTVFGQNTLRIRVNQKLLKPLFLFAWLTHPYIKQYIQGNAKNSTSFQSSLNKPVLAALPIPRADWKRQEEYGKELENYFAYIRNAEELVKTLQELQEIWYGKIQLLYQQGEQKQGYQEDQKDYLEGRYWVTPSRGVCYYDSYLECIQAPEKERRSVRLSFLPLGAEVQFLNKVRTADQADYGCLEHIRLKRTDRGYVQVIRMEPVAYRSVKSQGREDRERELEDCGILSEQQDFGYIRGVQEVKIGENVTVEQFLSKYSFKTKEGYSRFRILPSSARLLITKLSGFQQAVFEEFLLAMQPLACHMVGRQVWMRAGGNMLKGRGIQDVIATVRFLEHAGLLEKRQGLYLDYDNDYSQGEKREMILDHRGQPVPMDTWICAEVKE